MREKLQGIAAARRYLVSRARTPFRLVSRRASIAHWLPWGGLLGGTSMFTLSRREFLASTAATTAALSLGLTPSEIHAAAPPVGKQAASFYRYKIGDFEVTQIADGARTFPMPDQFVVNQKKEDALAAAEA